MVGLVYDQGLSNKTEICTHYLTGYKYIYSILYGESSRDVVIWNVGCQASGNRYMSSTCHIYNILSAARRVIMCNNSLELYWLPPTKNLDHPSFSYTLVWFYFWPFFSKIKIPSCKKKKIQWVEHINVFKKYPSSAAYQIFYDFCRSRAFYWLAHIKSWRRSPW